MSDPFAFTHALLQAVDSPPDWVTEVEYQHRWGEMPRISVVSVALDMTAAAGHVSEQRQTWQMVDPDPTPAHGIVRPLLARRSLRNRIARELLRGFDPTWERIRWALYMAAAFDGYTPQETEVRRRG